MLRERQRIGALQESGLSLNSVREMSVGCNWFNEEFASSLCAGTTVQIAPFFFVNPREFLFIGKAIEHTLYREDNQVGVNRSVSVKKQTDMQRISCMTELKYDRRWKYAWGR